MKKLLLAFSLMLLPVPSYAGCVMGLEGADKAIAEYKMVKHVLTGARLSAFVAVNRERAPEYALEADTTAVWLLVSPQDNAAFVIEVSEKCVTYQPEQIPLAAARQILAEISKRTTGA